MARHRSRIAGKEELNFEQFMEVYKRQSLLPRLDQNVRTLGQFCYRKSGLFFAEQQYLQASLYLGMAIASNPLYSIPRVWKQKLSPEARQSLEDSKNLDSKS